MVKGKQKVQTEKTERKEEDSLTESSAVELKIKQIHVPIKKKSEIKESSDFENASDDAVLIDSVEKDFESSTEKKKLRIPKKKILQKKTTKADFYSDNENEKENSIESENLEDNEMLIVPEENLIPNGNINENGSKQKGDIFYVDKILERKKVGGKVKYLIKWEGFGDDENSWEPYENLMGAKDLVKEFNANIKKTKPISSNNNELKYELKNVKFAKKREIKSLNPNHENNKEDLLIKNQKNLLRQKAPDFSEISNQKFLDQVESDENEEEEYIIKPNNNRINDSVKFESNIMGPKKRIRNQNKSSLDQISKKKIKRSNSIQKTQKLPNCNKIEIEDKENNHLDHNTKRQLRSELKPNMTKIEKDFLNIKSEYKNNQECQTEPIYSDIDSTEKFLNSVNYTINKGKIPNFGDFRIGDEISSIKKIKYNQKMRLVYAIVEWKIRENGTMPLKSSINIEQMKKYASKETVDFLIDYLISAKCKTGDDIQ